ncbi:MAG: hypothetical protein RL154_91 [Pseudomonadota bacterium]|jgi:uncharacterized low-complexity protein
MKSNKLVNIILGATLASGVAFAADTQTKDANHSKHSDANSSKGKCGAGKCGAGKCGAAQKK